MSTDRIVRVANAQGFWGDSQRAKPPVRDDG